MQMYSKEGRKTEEQMMRKVVNQQKKHDP